MNPTPPGWYPDPQDLSALRWFDGQSWTDHRAAAPAAGTAAGPTGQSWQGGQPSYTAQAPAGGHSSSTRVLVILASVVGGFILLSLLAAIAIPLYLNQQQKASLADIVSLSCRDVAAEAVAFSTKNAPQGKIPLVGMTDAVLVTDQRAGLQVPATGSKAFVMSCRGTGQWEDGVSSSVTVRLYLTSDRKHWISISPK